MQVRGVEFAHAPDHLRDRRHHVWLKVRESAKDSFMVAEFGSVHAFDTLDPFLRRAPRWRRLILE